MGGAKRDPAKLTAAELKFCLELVKPGADQTSAFRLAFPQCKKWKPKSVTERASRLMLNVNVRSMLGELREKITAQGIMTTDEALLRLSNMSRVDIRKCYHENGRLKLPHEIDDITAQAVFGYDASEIKEGKKRSVRGTGIRLIKATEAIEKLLKHYHRRLTGQDGRDITPEVADRKADYDIARRIAYALTMHKPEPKVIEAAPEPVKKKQPTTA